MHEMLTILTDVRGVCLSVCLSCSSSWLRCAKMAEHIKMLFEVNYSWKPTKRTRRDPPTDRDRGPLSNFGKQSYIYEKVGHRPSGAGSRDLILNSGTLPLLYPEWLKIES